LDAVDFYRGFRVLIGQDSKGNARIKRIHFNFEIVKVVYGPVDLYPNANQIWSHDGEA
jgi:hypothetical protein